MHRGPHWLAMQHPIPWHLQRLPEGICVRDAREEVVFGLEEGLTLPVAETLCRCAAGLALQPGVRAPHPLSHPMPQT